LIANIISTKTMNFIDEKYIILGKKHNKKIKKGEENI
jgi:hypothetical protein